MDNGVGGQLHGISLDSFLQMVQMEKSNCTLKVTTDEDMGWLFILKGNLIAAETGAISGMEAACAIISWENSIIEIDNVCEKKVDEIKQPLMNILMEGLRLRDENRQQSAGKKGAPPQKAATAQSAPKDVKKKKAAKSAAAPSAPKQPQKPQPKPAADTVTVEPKKKFAVGKIPMMAGALVLVIVCGYLAFSFFGGGSEKSYEEVLAQVQVAENIDKIILLETYVKSHEPSEETQDAEARIKKIKTLLEKADFNNITRIVKEFTAKGDYQKAVSALQQHLKKYPRSFFKGNINKQLAHMSELMETSDFEHLASKADELGADRMDLYLGYLKNHPKGKHRKEVEKRIEDMATEYFIHIEAQILKKDTREDWDACIELAQKYASIYPLSPRTEQLSKLQDMWKEKIREKQIFQTLKRSADDQGTDYAAAALIYTNYLNTYPNSFMKDKIDLELARLDQLRNDQRMEKESQRLLPLLADSKGRFVENGNGTVTDTKTGLMWCTLDSRTVENGCLTYDEAVSYVKNLRTGGHDDWRIPTPEELAALYKKEPFFPQTESEWYWSAATNRRYMGEWVTDVEVVTSTSASQQDPEIRDARACGSVRAVRKAK